MRLIADIRDGLVSQPARLALSLLAIVLGVLVLSVLLCLVGGIREKAGAIVKELGVNVLAITPNRTEGPLLPEHIDQLRAAFPDAVVSAVRAWSVDTRDGKTRLNVLATDADLLRVRPWMITDGRFLDPRDVGEGRYHCVIGRDLSERMQWRVGQALAVKDQYFTIVGVFEAEAGGADSGVAQPGLQFGENRVIIPDTVPPYWLRADEQPAQRVDVAYIKLPAADSARAAVARCRAILQSPADREHRFSYLTPESLVAHLRRLQHAVQWSAGSLAFLCMLLGGTTLASLMIANVQERIREIGLRLALGASEWSIGALFVVEALLLTLTAGVMGTMLAHGLLYLLQAQLPVPIRLSGTTLFAPIGLAMVFALFFSWWPARRATRIRPADALRNE